MFSAGQMSAAELIFIKFIDFDPSSTGFASMRLWRNFCPGQTQLRPRLPI